jgi:ABC-2 type transport system permease protein
MNFRRTRAMARKEFLHIVRDSRSLAMALAVPVMMLLLFGYALSLDVDRIPTYVYDQDRTPESRELLARFEGSRYFQILGYTDNYRDIELRVDRSECLLGVVVPHRYAQDLLAGRESHVQLLLDGSDSNTASIARGYAETVTAAYSRTPRTAAPAPKHRRQWTCACVSGTTLTLGRRTSSCPA